MIFASFSEALQYFNNGPLSQYLLIIVYIVLRKLVQTTKRYAVERLCSPNLRRMQKRGMLY